MANIKYRVIPAAPKGSEQWHWAVRPVDAGHTIEVAYSDGAGRPVDPGYGSQWRRATDRSLPVGHPGRVVYERRVGRR